MEGKEEFILDFIFEPDDDGFLKSRKSVMKHPDFDPYSDDLSKMEEFLAEGKFNEIINYKNINIYLSPRAHLMKSYAYKKLKQDKQCDIEMILNMEITEAIIASGKGTYENPYKAIRVEDENDVLEFLGEEKISQSLINEKERKLDVQHTKSGNKIYFDITGSYENLQNKLDNNNEVDKNMNDLEKKVRVLNEQQQNNIIEKKISWWKFW